MNIDFEISTGNIKKYSIITYLLITGLGLLLMFGVNYPASISFLKLYRRQRFIIIEIPVQELIKVSKGDTLTIQHYPNYNDITRVGIAIIKPAENKNAMSIIINFDTPSVQENFEQVEIKAIPRTMGNVLFFRKY